MIVDNAVDVDNLWHYVKDTQDAIFVVSGGISAQRRLQQINYDLDAIITDLTLDDVDGITLTEHIRRNESIRGLKKNCLIFWFTKYPLNDTLRKLQLKYNVTEIFSKALDPIEIITKVKAHIALN